MLKTIITIICLFSLFFALPSTSSAHTETALAQTVTPEMANKVQVVKDLNGQLSSLASTLRWTFWPSSRRELISQMQSLAATRKDAMVELAENNTKGFISALLPSSDRQRLSGTLPDQIEAEVDLTGQLETIHWENFDQDNPLVGYYYFLRVGDDRYSLYTTRDLYLRSETTTRVRGWRLGEIIVVDPEASDANVQVVGEPAPPSGAIVPGQRDTGDFPLLVFLVDFNDSPERPFTREEAHDIVFNSQLQSFYDEQSYGQVSFSGDVTDWIRLDRDTPDDICGSVQAYNGPIANYILNHGINLLDYYGVVFVLSGFGYAGGCGSVGQYFFPGHNLSWSWISSFEHDSPRSLIHPFSFSNLTAILAHELGHNLGLHHTGGLDCHEESLAEDCDHVEYGNSFDVMGSPMRSSHMNGNYKDLLGWLPPGGVLIITEPGQYTIGPLETVGGVKTAKIQLPDGSVPYDLEYRRGIGFDRGLNDPTLESNQSGLFVNYLEGPSSEYGGDMAHLLDMRPTTDDWSQDTTRTTLNLGQTFFDEGRELTIGPVISATDDSITFDVSFAPPVDLPPAWQWSAIF